MEGFESRSLADPLFKGPIGEDLIAEKVFNGKICAFGVVQSVADLLLNVRGKASALTCTRNHFIGKLLL